MRDVTNVTGLTEGKRKKYCRGDGGWGGALPAPLFDIKMALPTFKCTFGLIEAVKLWPQQQQNDGRDAIVENKLLKRLSLSAPPHVSHAPPTAFIPRCISFFFFFFLRLSAQTSQLLRLYIASMTIDYMRLIHFVAINLWHAPFHMSGN